MVANITKDLSEREANDALQAYVRFVVLFYLIFAITAQRHSINFIVFYHLYYYVVSEWLLI